MGFAPLNPSYLLVMKQMDAAKAEREMEMRRRQCGDREVPYIVSAYAFRGLADLRPH